MAYYQHDSFGGGPSLSLRQEELDRLDASQIEPCEAPSLRFDTEHYKNLEESINGTINALNGAREDNYFARENSHGGAMAAAARRDAVAAASEIVAHNPFLSRPGNMVLTPPSSQPYSVEKPGHGQMSMVEVLKAERDKAIADMQHMCDQRVEAVQRSQADRVDLLEGEYRKQLAKLQLDLDNMLRQHQQVIKLKNEVEHGLQMELDVARRDLKREKDTRESEKERHARAMRETNERLRELQRSVVDGEEYKGRGRRVTFSGSGSPAREYERRLAEMQRESDSKISGLARQFEKEKAAALEILKTRIKAEVNLLVPRIKEQCQRSYVQKMRQIKDTLAAQFRSQYEDTLRRMRDEHAMERRMWQRQMREQLEHERAEIAQKLKAKYELKIMDVKNECERRILQRLRDAKHSTEYSDSDFSFV